MTDVQTAYEAKLAVEREADAWQQEQIRQRVEPLREKQQAIEQEIDRVKAEIYKQRQEMFGQREIDANVAVETAREQHAHAKIEAALKNLPFPEGTHLVQWVKVKHVYGEHAGQRRWIKVSPRKEGKFQVFRMGDEHGMRGWRWRLQAPKPGDYVVRLSLKSGKPSKTVVAFSRSLAGKWFLMGVNPNEVENESNSATA